MKNRSKWVRGLYITGVIAFLIGAIDPMEGSVVIFMGISILSFATCLSGDRHQRIFSISEIMICVGVFFLFVLSTLGGFGGNSNLSWWWGTLILPYPAGWLMGVSVLVYRFFHKIGHFKPLKHSR